MSRRKILLLIRIILFVALGLWFIWNAQDMEVAQVKLLFIGIGVADFIYAGFLSRPFWQR